MNKELTSLENFKERGDKQVKDFIKAHKIVDNDENYSLEQKEG